MKTLDLEWIAIKGIIFFLKMQSSTYNIKARTFWAYAKQLMQINKLLCTIHKLVKVVYEKTPYEDTISVSENLW